jgi:hypothetical protein
LISHIFSQKTRSKKYQPNNFPYRTIGPHVPGCVHKSLRMVPNPPIGSDVSNSSLLNVTNNPGLNRGPAIKKKGDLCAS